MPLRDFSLPAEAPIGLYDSGVGGLSVWQAVRAELPAERLIYVADTAHVPYGEKSRHAVVARAEVLGEYFRGEGVKAIVVPCNTATAAAITQLRERHPGIPVIGIEPAVKPAARLSRSGRIGVLATTGTLASPRFRQLVAREAETAEVMLRPCPEWVMLVERGELHGSSTRRAVAEVLEPLLAARADVLVLGCTHFPFLRKVLRQVAGPDIPILETGPAVAKQLRRQLEAHGTLHAGPAAASGHRFLASGDPTELSRVAGLILGQAVAAEALPTIYR
ncbi:MAG: glutamate racemase [Pigmentiphaga sp.]|nr:glutamate racemase [Pigmentiphaga sp.]